MLKRLARVIHEEAIGDGVVSGATGATTTIMVTGDVAGEVVVVATEVRLDAGNVLKLPCLKLIKHVWKRVCI